MIAKICVLCGKDVASEKRVKDSHGRYYCIPCSQPKTPAPQKTVPLDDGEFDLAPVPETPKPARSQTATLPNPTAKAASLAPGPACPCCNNTLVANAKICVDCGIKIPSGKPMITALGRDENLLYANAEAIIYPLAWLLRFGLYPIASEAYATKKPIVTWIVAALTTIASIWFFIALRTGGEYAEHPAAISLMLWPPAHHVSSEEALDYYRKHAHDKMGQALRDVASMQELQDPSEHDAPIEQRAAAVYAAMMEDNDRPHFRWFQLLTNTLLHDPSSIFGLIMHLAGNMLFLLIFGTRVNALIGNLKMAILYPLLGVLASAAHLYFEAGSSAPALGASGAIMGLAGMYLIFFPVHRVYMAIWLKLSWRFETWLKIWPTRGFWVLAFYLSFDVVSTLIRSRDGVAHWAHLGGFIAGILIATALLIARLQHAHHADLLSVLLGKHAWPLIGKPHRIPHTAAVRF